ncbi:MAG: phosphatidylserine decarboxylase family protein [Bacteroidales bacterium]|nr:phosphatidylserine decarboxylase family protein [Bacteroidales bacterium]
MGIHTEGIPFIIANSVIWAAAFASVLKWCHHPLLKVVLSAVCLFMFAIMIFFFRSPKREVTSDAELVVAPSDGEVVEVDKIYVDEYFGCECTRISVFLSLFNVHITWFPTGGEVVYSKYYPGAHFMAFLPKASEKNEHTSIVVRDAAGREVMFSQIAGIVARRIVCYAEQGAQCVQGSEAGFIKFGSRLTVLVPGDVEPLVAVGDKVKGSVTPLARFK